MKCCECKKEVDVTKNVIPPTWFGMYRGWTMIAMICSECIKDKEKLARWHSGFDEDAPEGA